MKLYKYLNPDRVDVIQNLKIRFTQPPYLNDPYETNPVVIGSELTDEQWEKIGRFETERNGQNFENFRHLMDRSVREEMFPAALQLMKVFFHHSTGILSLSETHDNALMWAHYCFNHQGYVIEFETSHSFFKTTSKDYTINNVSPIIYSPLRPNFTLEKMGMKELYFIKSDVWSYEREWRLLKSIQSAETKKNSGELALFDIPKEAITAVYLGAACAPQFEEEVVKIVGKNELTCRIFKMVLNPTTFDIDTISMNQWNELKANFSKDLYVSKAMKDIQEYLYRNIDK